MEKNTKQTSLSESVVKANSYFLHRNCQVKLCTAKYTEIKLLKKVQSYGVSAFLQYFLLLPFTLILIYSFKSNACINSNRESPGLRGGGKRTINSYFIT